MNPGNSSERRRKKKLSLGEIHPGYDGGIEGHQAEREVDGPHGVNSDIRRGSRCRSYAWLPVDRI